MTLSPSRQEKGIPAFAEIMMAHFSVLNMGGAPMSCVALEDAFGILGASSCTQNAPSL